MISRLLRPVNNAWLAAFRIAFGLSLCVSMLRFIAYGWVDVLFVRPRFRFKYWGFSWVEPLSAAGMHALFWALAGLALLVALGLFYRVAIALFVLGFFYLGLVDVSNYLNHYYLATLLGLLLAVSPANRRYSLDSRIGLVRASSTVPVAFLYLFRAQVGLVYFFAGVAKAHADWLFHAQPLAIWLGARSDIPLLGRLITWWSHSPTFFSWAGFLFDTSIVLFLLWRRTRIYAYLVVIAFHTTTRTLFPIGMFSAIMVLSALVFFEADWPVRLARRAARLLRRNTAAVESKDATARTPSAAPLTAPPTVPTPGARILVGLGVAYCAVQLLMPLRFLAYGGNVRWHEQGMRFSWRVMVREKNGSVTFVVTSQKTGRLWYVSPERYLTRLQEREMSGQPDLILQLAHHIAEDFERRGHGPVTVHADAWVSLNGRRMARLIDPEVDLTRVSDGIGRAEWILPAPSDPPPKIRPI